MLVVIYPQNYNNSIPFFFRLEARKYINYANYSVYTYIHINPGVYVYVCASTLT